MLRSRPLMRREILGIVLIALVALAVRVHPATDAVLADGDVNFLETDSWYHLRLIEHQVRNWPWRATWDPYAAPGGQFVPIAPFFDTLTATAVVLLHGREASAQSVALLAAVVPPILGTLAVLVVWRLGRRTFGVPAGLLGAALLAVLPGHFLDRTMLGFVDHHALEALLALSVFWALAAALPGVISTPPEGSLHSIAAGRLPRLRRRHAVAAGLLLGLYLLSWASGAFLLAILGAWLLVLVPLARTGEELAASARVLALAALIALVLVLLFQDARMHRYGSQVVGAAGLAAMALAVWCVAGVAWRAGRSAIGWIAVLLVAALGVAVMRWAAPDLLSQIWTDIARLAPDPGRMHVLEARPLFLYSGRWDWMQPWAFFRTGMVVLLVALAVLPIADWRTRRPIDIGLWCFALAALVATIGQNRFGYYLVPAAAVLGGWLGARVLTWGGVMSEPGAGPKPGRRALPAAGLASTPLRPGTSRLYTRELALVLVIGVMIAPNITPGVLLVPRSGHLSAYWADALAWLRSNTPPPFPPGSGGEEYYFARYTTAGLHEPAYTVMNWWDFGYWVVQRARRVPVANPTQERAPNAARFYVATSDDEAVALLAGERARYVIADWELPFRQTADGRIMGRFQSVVDWAGGEHARFYEVYYRREQGAWQPVWVFHEPYYRSMAFRLAVLGGGGVEPADATSVLTVADRVDGSGMPFREVLSQRTFATYDAARAAADAAFDGASVIAGLNPWQTAFPVEPVRALRQTYESRTPDQQPSETPWVRIFEVTR